MLQFLPTMIAILVCTTVCLGQKSGNTGANALSFELGKTGVIYNVTFDHKFAGKNFGYRFVAGSNFAKLLNVMAAGAGGYYLVGKNRRLLELGADLQYLIVDQISDDQKGFSFVFPNYSIKTFYPSLNIGYRHYGKSTLFRIAFSPGLIESKLVPGGCISYGLTF